MADNGLVETLISAGHPFDVEKGSLAIRRHRGEGIETVVAHKAVVARDAFLDFEAEIEGDLD